METGAAIIASRNRYDIVRNLAFLVGVIYSSIMYQLVHRPTSRIDELGTDVLAMRGHPEAGNAHHGGGLAAAMGVVQEKGGTTVAAVP